MDGDRGALTVALTVNPEVHVESARSTTHPHGNAFSGFDASVERVLGADMRLVYGMAVPILMVVGLIIILALSPAVWSGEV